MSRELSSPGDGAPFRPLAYLVERWIEETLAQPAPSGVEDGIAAYRAMQASTSRAVLLATDLHAFNVLAAGRRPWLVIDPKPFVGDRAYDATQHLWNCPERMTADPVGTVTRYAGLLGVDPRRVAGWMYARIVAEPREDWSPGPWDAVGERLRTLL